MHLRLNKKTNPKIKEKKLRLFFFSKARKKKDIIYKIEHRIRLLSSISQTNHSSVKFIQQMKEIMRSSLQRMKMCCVLIKLYGFDDLISPNATIPTFSTSNLKDLLLQIQQTPELSQECKLPSNDGRE